jgi:DNA-binding IclR family transcriptional regulator
MAKLALELKNPAYSRHASPAEIERETGIPGGTIRPKIRELLDEGVVRQDEDGYFVEPITFRAIGQLLAGEDS